MTDNRNNQLYESTISRSKTEGAFLALAAGDALGWPQEIPSKVKKPVDKGAHIEFWEWTRRGGTRYQAYEEVIHAGDYSDDTQLTLAVARSRINHGAAWWSAFTKIELPLWILYERGGGGATKRAAKAWSVGTAPWKLNLRSDVRRYFDAGGNGVAMRVLPHALFLAGLENHESLMHDVVLDGMATHGHPRALIGAKAYAYAAWSLARKDNTLKFGELLDALIDEGSRWNRFPDLDENANIWFDAAKRNMDESYQTIWKNTSDEMFTLLKMAREGLKAGALANDHEVLKDLGCFGRTKGAGTSSAVAAIYLVARHAAQPVQGILRAAFENGADTDTLAAMTGGLMGCLSGVEWLPQPWLKVQDAKYLKDIAARITLGPDSAAKSPIRPLTPISSIFSDLSENSDREILLGGTIPAFITTLPDPKPVTKSTTARAWRLKTFDGQTIYVTKIRRQTNGTYSHKPVDETRLAEHIPSVREPAESVIGSVSYKKDALYQEFCRQLPNIFEVQELRPKEIEEALGLVRSQAKKWLEQAVQDGLIQQTSKKPIRFVLRERQKSWV